MTSTPLSSAPSVRPRPRGAELVSRQGWVWIGLMAAAFIMLHWNFVRRTYLIATDQWGGDWSHALAIPFISIFYIFLNREELAQLPRRTCWYGLPILFAGIFSYAFWIAPGRNDMFQGYSMIVGLFGLVLFLLGPSMMRLLWFPILFLTLAVKISDRIWENIAAKLQLIAAQTATIILNIIGIEAEVRGSTIEIFRDYQPLGALNVAEACAGLRMLMAFVALGVAIAFLFDRERWQRLIMVLSTVPIAITVNVARVTIMGVLYTIDPALSTGDFHKFVGLLMLIPAMLLYLLLGWILDKIIIKDPAPAAPKPAPVITNTPPIEPQPDWIVRGLIAGAGLTLLVGTCYFLLIGAVRPGFLGAHISTVMSRIALAVAAVAIVVAMVYIRRSTSRTDHPDAKARTATITTAIGGGILFTSVLGIYGVLMANDFVLRKEPLPLREPLLRVPTRFGTWEMIAEDPPLSRDILEQLGTKEYFSRIYRDKSRTGPGTDIKLHLAYYTGTPDTVPHVPDRCWVAGGMTHMGITFPTITLPADSYSRDPDGTIFAPSQLAGRVRIPASEITATAFTFSGGEGNKAANVVYFFVANGKFLASPDTVRARGFDPRDKFAFYCKVELGMFDIANPEDAAKRAAEFLATALPEILACLPDWHEVQTGQWPANNKKK